MAIGEDFFGDGFLGLAEIAPESLGIPSELNAYQNTDAFIVAYWTISPLAFAFYSFKWELQTDLVDTFDSADLLSYSSDTIGAGNYLSGCIHKGMVVPIYAREQGVAKRMYWRVRPVFEDVNGVWRSSYFDIPPAVNVEVRTAILSWLPDAVYDKTPGTVPGVGSNIYKIHDNFANEFERANRTLTAINNDYYIKSARDSALVPNFGELYGIEKRDLMSPIDYREILRTFMTNIRSAPNDKAVRNMVYSIYRNEPVFRHISDVYGRYVLDIGLDDTFVYDAGIEDVFMWDNEHLATGVIIEVLRQLSCGTVITKEYVEGIVQNMVLAHTPFYIKEV